MNSLIRIGKWCGIAVATGFGLGLSPIAPGTFGTLLGIPLVWAIQSTGGLGVAGQAAAAAALAALAVPFCEIAERYFRTKDDHRIVADEYLTFPICTIGLPCLAHPWLFGVAFLTNRACDILKPPPARGLQRLHGGVGIVVDDVIAAFYSLLLNHLIFLAARRWGIGG